MDAIARYKETRDFLFQEAGIEPQSHMVQTDGPVNNVHYLELGSGKALIIIHGGGSHASEWIPILKPLSEHFHLYVIDRPGHGLTDPFNYRGIDYRECAIQFVRSFMDAVDLQQALFMGNSMGGYFCLSFAMAYPERVQKLVLIGAPAGMNRWIPYMLRLLGTKGVNSLLIKTVAKPGVSNLKNFHKKLLVADVSRLSDTYIEHCYYNQLLPGSMTSFRTLLENVLTVEGWREDLYIGDQLYTLDMPVRFIWGDNDAFEKPETGKQKAKTIKNYRFEVVANAGHCPWLDQPEKCASLIISMLRE